MEKEVRKWRETFGRSDGGRGKKMFGKLTDVWNEGWRNLEAER